MGIDYRWYASVDFSGEDQKIEEESSDEDKLWLDRIRKPSRHVSLNLEIANKLIDSDAIDSSLSAPHPYNAYTLRKL